MSKSKSLILAKPFKEAKVQKKLVSRVMRRVERKIAIEKKATDPYNLRAAFKQQMLTGQIGYIQGGAR